MIQPTKTPFIVRPVLTFRNLIIKAFLHILKIAGESELPSLTRYVHQKALTQSFAIEHLQLVYCNNLQVMQ